MARNSQQGTCLLAAALPVTGLPGCLPSLHPQDPMGIFFMALGT